MEELFPFGGRKLVATLLMPRLITEMLPTLLTQHMSKENNQSKSCLRHILFVVSIQYRIPNQVQKVFHKLYCGFGTNLRTQSNMQCLLNICSMMTSSRMFSLNASCF